MSLKLKPSPQRFIPLDPREPEWIRVADLKAKFAISRTTAFRLFATGELETRHIKAPGARRGYLVVSVASVRRYIESFASSTAGGIA